MSKSMSSESESTLVHLLAGQRPDGQLIFEDVSAKAIGDGCYELLASPLFCRGAAKGDLIRVQAAGKFDIEKHGGNLCIRVISKSQLDIIETRLNASIKTINGECETRADRILVYSVPVTAGFDAIEKVFDAALNQQEDSAWLYANVYDPMDGETPLNWWHDYLAK